MSAKFSFFLTLSFHLLVLLYTNRQRVVPSTSDQRPLIEQAQEKINAMTVSMKKSGYGSTASILQANLKRFIHECGFMRRNITIFAPRDEAMIIKCRRYCWLPIPWDIVTRPPFPVHIITLRIEEVDFWSDRIVRDTFLFPACEPRFSVHVSEHPRTDQGRTSINKARVLNWNIYRDDFVVVHGVDTIFENNYHYRGGRNTREAHYLPRWIIPWETRYRPYNWTFDHVYGNQTI